MMPQTLLVARGLDLSTLEGRPLLRDLTLEFGRERVAIVGRNGVGKSSLLRVLAGEERPQRGSVRLYGSVVRVPQILVDPDTSRSRGEQRRDALRSAFRSAPDLLLLDEPTEDLDTPSKEWLYQQLALWKRGLIVVSHDPELLEQFTDFFVVAESGCQHFSGHFEALTEHLAAQHTRSEEKHTRALHTLAQQEEEHHRVQRRRQRKRAVGRLHELDRSQSRMRLNKRRSHAQVSQARVRAVAEARIDAKQRWALATRRALAVSLPLDVVVPALPPSDGRPILSLDGVSLSRGGRTLFAGVTLTLDRERLAVVGPNGSGKTSLLQVMLREIRETSGAVRCRLEHIGAIAQGASDWMSSESLIETLARTLDTADLVAQRLVAHRFPLALAHRPLRSLSPGERTRAALISLLQRPSLRMLILDEPTYSLDQVGVTALTEVLRAFQGGLVIASHDQVFLDRIGVNQRLTLAG